MYKAIVAKVDSISPIEGADRIQKAIVCGFQVIVGKDIQPGELGIFFPTDGQFSHDMCYENNLYRAHKGVNKTPNTFGYLEENRRIKNIRMKGTLSEGLFMPLDSVLWTGVLRHTLVEGFQFDELNGHPIANKYYTEQTRIRMSQGSNKLKKTKRDPAPQFKKHFDTEQLMYYKHILQPDVELVVTEKLHGTSGRTGHVIVYEELSKPKQKWNDFIHWAHLTWTGFLFQEQGNWDYVTGTRNTILNRDHGDGYHDGNFRQQIHKSLLGKLPRGMVIYYEIVGWEGPGLASIMPRHRVPKDADSAFKKRYAEEFTYSYGCTPGEFDFYVYRITYLDDNYETQEYDWNTVQMICSGLGLKTVPVLVSYIKGLDGNREETLDVIRSYAHGPSILDNTHPKEGICIRVLSGPRKHTIFKYKSPMFSYMEGFGKEAPDYIDPEEIA